MMKIGICDDDETELMTTANLLSVYQKAHGHIFTCQTFQNPFEFLDTVERGTHYDIILLDVIMPVINGIDVACEIRKYDTNVKIIFLTSSPEFALQSYSVKAYYYQLKPLGMDAFFHLLDELRAVCETDLEQGMVVKCKNEVLYIEYRKLEFCEVIGKLLLFHLTGGRVIETVGSMQKLSRHLLEREEFVRPHRSYLINMDYVHSIKNRIITMQSLVQIPLPHGKYTEMKDTYLKYSFPGRDRNESVAGNC